MDKIRQIIQKITAFIAGLEIGIRQKLLYGFVLITMIPLFAIGAITYIFASNALMEKATSSLEAIGSTKTAAIETFFDERRADMNVLREIVFTMQQEAFSKLVAVRENKIIWIEDYLLNRIGDMTVLSKDRALFNAAAAFINAGAVDGHKWKRAVTRYGSWLTTFKETYGYYNLYLVSADGKILYSVSRESDLGENLKRGRLKDSPAGKAFRKGLKGVAMQDFEPYEPIAYLPAAFVAAPITSARGTVGVVMGQLSMDGINGIIQERTGLSETAEAYLVSKTKKGIELRSERVVKTGRVGDIHQGPYLERALGGESGTGFKMDDEGVYKLSAYAPIKVPHINWAINVTAHVEEIISPKFEQAEEDFFTYYKEGYGYLNFYLINPDGYLFYSVIHEPDYHTNLLSGPYKDTNMGKIVRRVLDTQQLQISDFEKYAPSQNAPAAFIAQPVTIDGHIVLIVAAQLTTSQIQVIMEDYTGLGETGDTYLVGADKLWRTDSRFLDQLMVDSTILHPDFADQSDALQQALTGMPGNAVRRNYRNQKVLSSWSRIMLQPPSDNNPGVAWAMFSDITIGEVRRPVTRLAMICAIVLGITLVGVLLLSFGLAEGLTAQVNRIMNLFSDIGMGQYEARAEVVSKDELGTMAASLNAMLDNTLSLIQSREERDAIQDAVMKLLNEISALTEGDLTVRAEVTEHITGAIADSFNTMAEQLTEIIKDVKITTFKVGDTSNKVSDATVTLADISKKQAQQVRKAIKVINDITASVQQVAENASKSSNVSKRSMLSARKGAKAVEKTNVAMTGIRERVQESARAIKRLGESSQEIGNIVQIITDIADRTSILALNASIQAAMAGDAGRGFAVVAEEVQRLAERSAMSTKQIETLVKNIQGDIFEAGKSMDESIQQVVEGSTLANDAYGALQEIETVSRQVAKLVHTISKASQQQSEASKTAAKTMLDVGEISAQASNASKQTAASMQVMSKIADRLRVSVETFKIEDAQPHVSSLDAEIAE